jgi:uncharacterized protein YdhG (YjbR/CyaY superfamily)
MKNKKPPTGRRSPQKRSVPTTVEEYFARVPEPAHSSLTKLRAGIRSAIPRDAVEIISYRMPAFRRNGVVVWYAAFADHCSLFPGASVLEQFKAELAGFKTSKGTVQFPLDQPLPIALIKRIVKVRVAEREAKKGR